jgi:hypothetical protein
MTGRRGGDVKLNCWEFKKCGRETGGARAAEMGVCPACTEARLDGTHDGRNAGRACWVVAGTLCKGEVQGIYAKKYGACAKCDFYAKVKAEEYPHFILSAVLLDKIGQ